MRRFFLIVSPGLEDLAQKELLEKTSLYELEILMHQIVPGGIELEMPFEQGLSLNKLLKIPTRILLRLDSFKSRDFPKLFNKIKKLKWSDYLAGGLPEIKASSKESRLIHSGRIEETILKAIKKFYQENPIKKKYFPLAQKDPEKTIFARVVDDLMTISLDTSGLALYKRNQSSYRAPAAIRETFASAVYLDFLSNIKEPVTEIFDPFAGSGTILIEALNYHTQTQRDFIYQSFPITQTINNYELANKDQFKLEKLFGHEIDSSIFDQVKPNLEKYTQINYEKADSLNTSKSKDFLLCNPPYGIRIEKIAKNLNELALKLFSNYQFKYLGIIHPEIFKDTKNLKLIHKRKFSNNSIDVYFNIVQSF